MADPVSLTLASALITGGIGAGATLLAKSGGGGSDAGSLAAPAAPPAVPPDVQQPVGSPSGKATGAGGAPSFVGASAIPQQSNTGTKTLTGQ